MDTSGKLLQLFFIAFLCCLSSIFSTRAIAYQAFPPMLAPSLDAGIMIGYTGGSRRGVIVNPATSGSETNQGSQDSSEIGGQIRLLFGSEYNYRPFIYLNGAKPIGAPISILLGRILPPFTNATKLTLTSNWLARLGLGAATPWFYDTFQLDIGAAAVVMNQTLETYIGEAVTHTFNQNKTSVRPSLMGSVTWSLCEKCIRCHELLLTAQINVDSNPEINASVPSGIGPLNTRVEQAWVPRGDIILSVGLG